MKLFLLPGMDGTGELHKLFTPSLPGDIEPTIVPYPADEFLDYPALLEYVAARVPADDKDEPYVLLGESYSSTVVVLFAARRPKNLKGIVMCVGFVTSPLKGWKRAASSWLLKLGLSKAAPKRIQKKFLMAPNAAPHLLDVLYRVNAQVNGRVLTQRLLAIFNCDARKELRELELPVLYVQAMQDKMVGAECTREVMAINPRVRLEQIEGPHLVMESQPTKVAAAVTKFVRGLSI